jgi:hypothetical protein
MFPIYSHLKNVHNNSKKSCFDYASNAICIGNNNYMFIVHLITKQKIKIFYRKSILHNFFGVKDNIWKPKKNWLYI